jgi:hypothetical protein
MKVYQDYKDKTVQVYNTKYYSGLVEELRLGDDSSPPDAMAMVCDFRSLGKKVWCTPTYFTDNYSKDTYLEQFKLDCSKLV